MIINHNMNAMNAHRNMTYNTNASGKSMEKLSSGLRINRAGDDAAGLAISEKMRGQIRGLDQASRNSQDAISMIQTGEGALNETHSILQRMRELAVQAGNDTNTTSDRGEIQKEINQLTSEINRIGNTTEFNNQKLLNGNDGAVITTKTTGVASSAGAASVAATFTAGLGLTINAGAENGAAANSLTVVLVSAGTGASLTVGYDSATKVLTITASAVADMVGANIDPLVSALGTAGDIDFSKFAIGGTATDTTGATTMVASGAAAVEATSGAAGVFELSGKLKEGSFSIGGVAISIEGDTQSALYTDLKEKLSAAGTYTVTSTGTGDDTKLTLTQVTKADAEELELTGDGFGGTSKSFTMQVGANEGQTMIVDFEDMRSAALNITGEGAGFTKNAVVSNGMNNTNVEKALDVSNASNAGSAVTKIQAAIDQVSGERSKLGAFQNRLEHTINNLGTSSENLQAAESRIRDVDMAKEMMTFSKNNILNQAAQAMLAQANQQPQQVLQLLR